MTKPPLFVTIVWLAMADVAQLVRALGVVPEAVGSRPIIRPI